MDDYVIAMKTSTYNTNVFYFSASLPPYSTVVFVKQIQTKT